jgi:4-amino-4-deoxy-L-arabinose transferase-like glycosyltransferase
MMRTRRAFWYYLLLVLVILFFALIRWRLRDVPLERDEGEYAYAAQLILHGIPPYTLLYSMKLPGTFVAYAALLAIFGQTTTGIHLGLLAINSATIFLMFLLGKRLFDPPTGLITAASYALLSTSPSVIGFAGHATHFVVLPAMGGLLLLLCAIDSRRIWRYFASGLLFGLSFLMKQPGILFVVFGFAYLVYSEWRNSDRAWRNVFRRSCSYALGAMLPFALTCLVMVASGTFAKFWFWTFLYARQYADIVGRSEGSVQFLYTIGKIVKPAIGIWALAFVGLTAIAWNRPARKHGFLLITFLLCSALAVCPGLYFRKHYFVLLLPPIALLAGVAIGSATELLIRRLHSRWWLLPPATVFLVAVTCSIYVQRDYLFKMTPLEASQALYGFNPFPEAPEVADYIRSHTTAEDRIAVLGSEPEIYFDADRRSATGYIYTYGLMEAQPFAGEMQKQMIAEIEATQPKYIVFANVGASFGRLPGSERLIFHWMDSYLPSDYELVGVADIPGHYREEQTRADRPDQLSSRGSLMLFKRK